MTDAEKVYPEPRFAAPRLTEPRRILHVDMDAFYASVEVADDPTLAGKPLLVGGTSGRGVVCAASYQARKFGCRSAQPMSMALRLCPQAIVRKPRFDRYKQVSSAVFDILHHYSPLIETLSLDEAFVDLTGTHRLHGDAVGVARAIKHQIQAATHCTASVGVAPNKFLAKLASDLDKPDGLTILLDEEIERRLPTLPITRIWGIGPKTAERMHTIGLRTFQHLRNIDPALLTRRFGQDARRYIDLAQGIDDRPVIPDRDAKSIGQERTFAENLTDLQDMRDMLLHETESVAGRLRRHHLTARTVTLKLRYADFRTLTRRTTLPDPTDSTSTIWHAADALLAHWATTTFAPLRLLGIQLGNLQATGQQLSLFPAPQAVKQQNVDRAVDSIRAKFGDTAIARAQSTRAQSTRRPPPTHKNEPKA
jgi:DNA polymerase-4